MPNNKAIRDMIDSLIACDDQPNEARLGELRKALEHKVGDMKKKGQSMQRVMKSGLALMLFGVVLSLIAYDFVPNATWLLKTGIGVVVAGWGVVMIGAIIRARYLGLDYVWARHDLHDAVIMDLSMQVQKLSQRVDEFDQKNSVTP